MIAGIGDAGFADGFRMCGDAFKFERRAIEENVCAACFNGTKSDSVLERVFAGADKDVIKFRRLGRPQFRGGSECSLRGSVLADYEIDGDVQFVDSNPGFGAGPEALRAEFDRYFACLSILERDFGVADEGFWRGDERDILHEAAVRPPICATCRDCAFVQFAIDADN